MSGRGRPPGHFRNQKGFHGVRGRPRDTFTGGGSTATRSAASPSLRSRSLTPASENNAGRSTGKFRNNVAGSNNSPGGRLSLGRVGKYGDSKSSSQSSLPLYNRQTSANSSSSRSNSPDSRKRKVEIQTNNPKKARGLPEKRLIGKPKFQDNPSAPEIVDCSQPNKEQVEADLSNSCEGSSDAFLIATDKSSASGGSDDDSDTDSESSATEPIADNNVNSIDENDLVTNSNIDEDSLAENEKDSSHQINDQESAVEDESISSVSDIMSDAVCAFFKENSMNRDSNEENDINPANESSSQQISHDDSCNTMISTYNHHSELLIDEPSINELNKYINGKLTSSESITLSSKTEVKNRSTFKKRVSALLYEIISVSKNFSGKPLLDSYHTLDFVETMVNKFLRENSAKLSLEGDFSSSGQWDENISNSVQNGNEVERETNHSIQASDKFLNMLSKFVSTEINKAFMNKETMLGKERQICQLFENKNGATNKSDCLDKKLSTEMATKNRGLNSDFPKNVELSNSQISSSNRECLILQEIDAANAVSAVTGPNEGANYDGSNLDDERKAAAILDKNKLINQMEDKFAKDTNSALKKRPVYKKHGLSDLNTVNGRKKGEELYEQQKLKMSSKSNLPSASIILQTTEAGEVEEVSGKQKTIFTSFINSQINTPNQKILALTPPPQITNGSEEPLGNIESPHPPELQSSENATMNNTSGLVKSLRKVRVKRGRDKADEDAPPGLSNEVLTISDDSESTNLLISDTVARNQSNASNHESNQLVNQIRGSPLSPAAMTSFKTSPSKPNQGPRRYYERQIENNFILAPTILSKADAEQSTVALFKTPSSLMTPHSNYIFDEQEDPTEPQNYEKKTLECMVPGQLPVSSTSLKTVIRLPKIGSKKKGKRRFAECESDISEELNLEPSQEKRKKGKSIYSQSMESSLHSSINPADSLYDNEFSTHDSPSPEPQQINRLQQESGDTPDDTIQDTEKNSTDDKLQG